MEKIDDPEYSQATDQVVVRFDAPGDQAAWLTYRAELRDGAAILATRDGDLVTLPDPPEEG